MQLLHDLRFSLRQLRKAPVFTLVAVVTLALGIGANTAIFTLLDQALLRALPVSHPEQLVRLEFTGSTRGHFNSFGGDDHDYFSYPMYRDLRDQNSVFESLIASDLQNVSVQWNNKPDLVGCELASGNYFQALGLQPAMGRLFVPADDVPNSSPVVVLSFNYWKRQFGSDPRRDQPDAADQRASVHHRGRRATGISQHRRRRHRRSLCPADHQEHHHAALAGPGRFQLALDDDRGTAEAAESAAPRRKPACNRCGTRCALLSWPRFPTPRSACAALISTNRVFRCWTARAVSRRCATRSARR